MKKNKDYLQKTQKEVKETAKGEWVSHCFAPVYNENSKILMLGTMPSPKSREIGFYYSHPQNRFWSLLSDLLEQKKPETVSEKQAFLLRNHIALWDVLSGCSIIGADDSSIQNPVPNDLRKILQEADIKAIFTTGTKAASLYKKYCLPQIGKEAIA